MFYLNYLIVMLALCYSDYFRYVNVITCVVVLKTLLLLLAFSRKFLILDILF